MNLLRWNNAQRPQGKSVEPSASHSGQGLEVKKRFSLPVEGEVFSLTFPFIDQAVPGRIPAPLSGQTCLSQYLPQRPHYSGGNFLPFSIGFLFSTKMCTPGPLSPITFSSLSPSLPHR